MAVSSKGILAYQVRQGAHNEHSFIAFMLDLMMKVNQLGNDYVANTIFYADNHKAHTSEIAQRLLNMFGIPMLMAPIAYYQINPIELVFSEIKRTVRKSVFTNM